MSGVTPFCSFFLPRQISTNSWLPFILADQCSWGAISLCAHTHSICCCTLIRTTFPHLQASVKRLQAYLHLLDCVSHGSKRPIFHQLLPHNFSSDHCQERGKTQQIVNNFMQHLGYTLLFKKKNPKIFCEIKQSSRVTFFSIHTKSHT